MPLTEDNQTQIDRLMPHLHKARSLLFITGAGLSADSNLPTYRGIGGLYNDEQTAEGIPIEVALSGGMLASRPEVAWRHIARIEKACRGARFNRGHQVIAEMEAHFDRVWVLTQNVDGFHKQAGSKNIIDIHGDIHDLICTRCHYQDRVENYSGLSIPPKCPGCGAVVRPQVVLFGEMLPEAKVQTMLGQAQYGFDVVFSIGTSSLFPYISEPVVQAAQLGIPTVEINPDITDLSKMVQIKIAAGAAEALNEIWQRFQSGKGPT